MGGSCIGKPKEKKISIATKTNDQTMVSSNPSVVDAIVSKNVATSVDSIYLPDGISMVWLDARVNSNEEDIRGTLSVIQMFYASPYTFSTTVECLQFLRKISNEKSRILLIVSGSLSGSILSKLNELPVIDSVIIFCVRRESYQHLITEYAPYVVGVCSTFRELQALLEAEISECDTRALILNFFAQKQASIRDLTCGEASFLWFQLLKQVLMKTRYDKEDMKQMIEYCRIQCARDPRQRRFLADIDEFENEYTPDQAIAWYTRETFVYKLINAALRTEDIEALYIFRFYISDLCRQLAEECDKHRAICKHSPIVKVYRGCHMTKAEFDNLNSIKNSQTLITINGFISTSLHPMVADAFLSRNANRQSDVYKVKWEIQADYRIDGIIFSPVSYHTFHVEEEEVLFNIGSSFRIDDVVFNETRNAGFVKATATRGGLEALSDYMESFRRELSETSEKVILGTLLIDMGKYVIAQRYFEDVIQRYKNSNNPDLPDFHYNLGLTYVFQRDLHLAEPHFREALRYQQLDPSQEPDPSKERKIIRTLDELGWVHQESGELDEAINFYKDAESKCYDKLSLNDIVNAKTYTMMGRYYSEIQQYDESSTYYERALDILRLHLPISHQRFGIIYNEMGNAKRTQGKPEQAIELYKKAEDIFRKILPPNHPCIAYCWSVMGFAYLQMNDIKQAQQFHRQALDAYRLVLPSDHINIDISEKNLQCTDYTFIIDTYLQVCSQV